MRLRTADSADPDPLRKIINIKRNWEQIIGTILVEGLPASVNAPSLANRCNTAAKRGNNGVVYYKRPHPNPSSRKQPRDTCSGGMARRASFLS